MYTTSVAREFVLVSFVRHGRDHSRGVDRFTTATMKERDYGWALAICQTWFADSDGTLSGPAD